MENKREDKVSFEQKEVLVSFMEKHIDFARGKLLGLEGKIQSQKMWTELCVTLNNKGSEKTVTKWQRTWTDLKMKTKRKAYGIANSRQKSSGGTALNVLLTVMDERILAIMSKQAVFSIKKPDELDLDSKRAWYETPNKQIRLSMPNDNQTWVDEQQPTADSPSDRISDCMLSPTPSAEYHSDTEEEQWEEVFVKPILNQTTSNGTHTRFQNIAEDLTNKLDNLNNKIDVIIVQNKEFIQQKNVTNSILERIATAMERQCM